MPLTAWSREKKDPPLIYYPSTPPSPPVCASLFCPPFLSPLLSLSPLSPLFPLTHFPLPACVLLPGPCNIAGY